MCDMCGRAISPHGHSVVRIDVFADPSMSLLSGEDLEEMDFDRAFAELIEQMKEMSAEELQDQVHRRFEYRLCPACQRRLLATFTGKNTER